MLLLGLDFETTGLNVNEDRIIEIGAALWDTRRNKPVDLLNLLVNVDVDVPPVITQITGIEKDDLNRWGVAPTLALGQLLAMAVNADAIVAHNGLLFDKPLLEAECRRYSFIPPDQTWIDTSCDVPYPDGMKTRKLVYLAAEHGFVNPFAHRALSDVLTMMRVLSHYDAATVLATSKEPLYTLVATTKKPWEDEAPDGSKEADKARARGFRWDGRQKLWTKSVRESQLAAEKDHGEFLVKQLGT